MSTIPVPPESTKKLLDTASEEYHNQLPGSPGEEYLLQERGLTKSVLDYFQIGFVAKPLKEDDLYINRISIPFRTVSGVVAMQFRAVGPSDKRFLNRGQTKRLFNPSVLLYPHRTVYLCEGPIDTMTVAMLGLPAVGVPGVTQWSPVFARAFRNRRVVVLADGDDTGQGQQLAERVSTDVEECGIILFEGEDVNSYWVKHGADAMKEKLGIE